LEENLFYKYKGITKSSQRVHASIVTLSADEPLLSAQTTTLEKEHASLTLSLAHRAELILSLRLLDTGSASDVSGVVRINRGPLMSEREVEEKEYLYFVGGDGGVKVFERGQ
jgi:elongator complex protein 6